MADKTIGQLPELATITDASMLPIEDGGTAYRVSGASWKSFVHNSVSSDVTAASSAADDASGSASAASASAAAAEASRQAIEDLTVSGITLATGIQAYVHKSTSGGVTNFEFGLPRGATGSTGPAGPQGIQGPTGPQGPASAQVTPAEGTIFFSVGNSLEAPYEPGHLLLTYAGTTAPDYEIIDDPDDPLYGHLVWIVE